MRGNRLNLYWTNDNGEYNSWFASLIVRITLSWKWNGSLWFLTQFRDFITPWFWKYAVLFLIQCNISINAYPLICCKSKIWMDMWNSGWDIDWYIEAAWVSQIRTISYERSHKKTWTRPSGSTPFRLRMLHAKLKNDIRTGYQNKYP